MNEAQPEIKHPNATRVAFVIARRGCGRNGTAAGGHGGRRAAATPITMTPPQAPARRADRPCVDCLDEARAVRPQRVMAPRPTAFWLMAALFAVTMSGTTLPTPLYVIYQGLWHFSSGVVTLIFASYAGGVLAALLLAGRASDQVGRKPVLATALGLSALSTAAFIMASGLGWLFAGRVLSGLSAGLMTGTATATLMELRGAASSRRASLVATAANMGGLGLGPLLTGLFAAFAPDPTVLVFAVYLVALALAALGLARVPETVCPRQKLTLRFSGLGIPTTGRGEFLAAGGDSLAVAPRDLIRRLSAAVSLAR
jgi:MFS family permease